MNEERMNRLLMIAASVMTVLSGLGSIGLVVLCAIQWSGAVLFCAVLLAAATIGFGMAASYYGSRTQENKVFINQAEKEVLNLKQRRELRRARGEVVMERALVEVENERDNIVHRRLEAANDPTKPPHPTQWTEESRRELR